MTKLSRRQACTGLMAVALCRRAWAVDALPAQMLLVALRYVSLPPSRDRGRRRVAWWSAAPDRSRLPAQ